MKTLPTFKDIIGLYAKDEDNEVSTPDKADLQHFTRKQIEVYCGKALHPFWSLREAEILFQKSVQIIRQLQGQLSEAGTRLEDEGLNR